MYSDILLYAVLSSGASGGTKHTHSINQCLSQARYCATSTAPENPAPADQQGVTLPKLPTHLVQPGPSAAALLLQAPQCLWLLGSHKCICIIQMAIMSFFLNTFLTALHNVFLNIMFCPHTSLFYSTTETESHSSLCSGLSIPHIP